MVKGMRVDSIQRNRIHKGSYLIFIATLAQKGGMFKFYVNTKLLCITNIMEAYNSMQEK